MNTPEVRDNTSQHKLVTWYQPAPNLQRKRNTKIHKTEKVLIGYFSLSSLYCDVGKYSKTKNK